MPFLFSIVFFNICKSWNINVQIYKPFYDHLTNDQHYSPYCSGYFESSIDFNPANKLIFSIGGDGTFLQSAQKIQNYAIPTVGINIGRLGFLAEISQEEMINVLSEIFDEKYDVLERTMLQVDFDSSIAMNYNMALNEMTVLKTDTSSMINIKAFINGEFLNNYWADGLIIATPTGSTAYSLSVGGPILSPNSENFVITPIAPHNLTVRPLVVPDSSIIKLHVEGRGSHYLASLDSNSTNVEFSTSVVIKKANSKLKTVCSEGSFIL